LRPFLRIEQWFEVLPFCYCHKVAVSVRNAGKPDGLVKGNHLVTKFLKEWLHSIYLEKLTIFDFRTDFMQILKWATPISASALSAQEVAMLEDRRNSLLNRREIKVLFRGAAGKINRNEAAEKIANQLNINKKQVVPINLRCQTGMTDVHGVLYVYDDENEATRQLPRYRLLRTLTREERKKILAEEKAAKLKAKQEAATSKTGAAAGAKR
jgi:small subunit ribosomal protein S24e